jgi:hypothetical protein
MAQNQVTHFSVFDVEKKAKIVTGLGDHTDHTSHGTRSTRTWNGINNDVEFLF